MKLRIASGIPAFAHPLHVGKPHIEHEVQQGFFQAMHSVFERAILTNDGPNLRQFESRIASLHQVEHCIAVSSGTIALGLLIEALSLTGEVLLPSFTFIATAHAVTWRKLKPVFCDITPDFLTIDAACVEEKISRHTSAIIGVHIFGNLCDIPRLTEIQRAHNLHMMFDAAHAITCQRGGVSVGGFGVAEVLSFHATKLLSTFEGGAILTNDSQLATELRLLRNFGFHGYDDVSGLGINGKMTEVAATMGLASLSVLDRRLERLQQVRALYQEYLGGISGLRLVPSPADQVNNFHYAPFLVEEEFGLSRDLLQAMLWQENILARRYFYPGCHRMSPYKDEQGESLNELPITDAVCQKILLLPTNLPDPEKNIATMARVVTAIQEQADAVRAWAKNR